MINIKEELKTVESDLKAKGEDVNKYNLIKKLCDYIGENEFERESYQDIYDGCKNNLRLADGTSISYSKIRWEVDSYLNELEKKELKQELRKDRLCLGFLKDRVKNLKESTENDDEIDNLEKVISDIEKLEKDFLRVELQEIGKKVQGSVENEK